MSNSVRPEFDIRLVQYHLRNRKVDPKEYQAYLDSLPDVADEAVETKTTFDNPFERRHHEEQAEDEA